MIHLSLCDGPACTRCGCRDSTVTAEPRVTMVPMRDGSQAPWIEQGRATCGHCGSGFSFDPEPEKPEVPEPQEVPATPGCPECGSVDVFCTSSPKPKNGAPRVRYHKCRGCEHKFKSAASD